MNTLEAALLYKASLLNTTTKKMIYLTIKNESQDGKRWAEIPLINFCASTGKTKGYISQALKQLANSKLISCRKIRIGSSYVNQYIVNPME